jgi:hypothetical protein
MYNPNFAAMATGFLILAGEWFGDDSVLQRGVDLLDDLRRVLTRCGTIMEYGSPTYTPITTMVMAEIANYARDEQLVERALQCEERMWAEIVSRFHLPSGHFAGPYARAYWIDSVGHCTALHGLLHNVFGDAIVINPLRDSFNPRDNQVGHHGNSTLMWPNHVWLAGADLHCPDDLATLLLNPPDEMVTIAKTECIPCTTEGETRLPDGSEPRPYRNPWEYAASSGPNYTYLTPAFSLGTGYSQFHDGGLSESFYLTYPLNKRSTRLEESRVVFLRYLINDREPEQENRYSVYGVADSTGFRDEARKFGLQDRDISLMVYKPKQYEQRSVRAMRLSVVVPCHYAEVGGLFVGETPVRAHDSGESEAGDPRSTRLYRAAAMETVYLADGAIVAAFVPLATTDFGGGATVIERRGNYLFLSFVNYEGPARSFSEEELFLARAGLVAHVKSVRNGWTVDRLRDEVGSFTLTDRMRAQLGGTLRWIRYGNGSRELEFAYSPRSEGIMIAAVDGRPRPAPVFSCSALPAERLPFLA